MSQRRPRRQTSWQAAIALTAVLAIPTWGRAEVALVAQGRVQEVEYRSIGFRRVTMPELLHFVVNEVPVFLRRAYAPLMLSFDFDTYLYLWAINDTREPVTGTVKLQLYHLQQNEFRKKIVGEVIVAPGKSIVVVQLDQAGIRAFRKEHILFATLTDDSGQVLARTNAFADIERRLTFPEAKLDPQWQQGALVLTADKFARCVTLSGDANGDAFGWFFEDYYFDLLPGEEKVVRIMGDHEQGRISAKAWYSPHTTTVDWQRAAAKQKR